MIHYILLLIFNCLLYYLFGKKNRKLYLLLVFFSLLFMTTFRDINLGLGDTVNVHIPLFEKVKSLSIQEIFNEYSFVNGILFALFAKMCTYISDSYRVFLMLSALPFIIGSFLIINRYSKNTYFSMLILITVNYFFCFLAVRQYFAMGFILISLNFIVDKRPVCFLLTIITASLIHFSAIIFLPAYFYYMMIQKGFLNIILVSSGIVVSLFFKNLIFNIIAYISPNYYYYYLDKGIYTKGDMFSLTWFLVLLVYLGLYYYVYHRKNNLFVLNKHERVDKILFSILSMGIVVFCLSSVVVEFYRISYYFSIFAIILIPNLLEKIKDRNSKIFFKLSAQTLFIAYFFLSYLQNINCLNFAYGL
ncbi:MAG: EpsG family protein [Bacilli bacterium]|nr:EpsG family protein [Bacilli bacterium]